MHVKRGADAQSDRGSTFTGEVTLDRLMPAQTEGGINISVVHFENGARTHWHEHPGEQALYILEGEARAGTPNEEIRASVGDVIYMPPNERHWHGAIEGGSMTHISITNVGSPTWYEAVE